MIPSVIVACEFDPDLCVSAIIYVEIPKKTFEEDMKMVFKVPKEKAAELFTKMYGESKIEKKFDSHYKALRGLVRNVWFMPFEKTFNKLPNEDSPLLKFYSNDYFYIVSLPTRMLASDVYDLYQELLEKDKLKMEEEQKKLEKQKTLEEEQKKLEEDKSEFHSESSQDDALLVPLTISHTKCYHEKHD